MREKRQVFPEEGRERKSLLFMYMRRDERQSEREGL